MPELIVRRANISDEPARCEIVKWTTQELRNTYRPRDGVIQCGGVPNGVLIALDGDIVVGTAEYVLKDNCIYAQGVAVHPSHRKRGVCRALLLKVEEIAKTEKRLSMELCAIEETGNVQIFEKLGFRPVNRACAPKHVSPNGGPVTQVDMERAIV